MFDVIPFAGTLREHFLRRALFAFALLKFDDCQNIIAYFVARQGLSAGTVCQQGLTTGGPDLYQRSCLHGHQAALRVNSSFLESVGFPITHKSLIVSVRMAHPL